MLEGENCWKWRDKSGTRNVAKLSAKEVPSLPNAAINAAWTKPRTPNYRAVNETILNQADGKVEKGSCRLALAMEVAPRPMSAHGDATRSTAGSEPHERSAETTKLTSLPKKPTRFRM